MINKFEIEKKIKEALLEDIPTEDITTNSIYKDNKMAAVTLFAKEDGIIAGKDVFKRVFEILDNNAKFKFLVNDGDEIKNGQVLATITGNVRSLLTGERVALNFMQRMSGIASYTKKCIEELDDPKIKLLDTRKTTPNMRIFEKYSVRVGGGYNHRYNLSEAIMIKDNHIKAAGSIKKAVGKIREYSPFIKKIEVEVESLKEVQEALDAKVDIIMLDNMSIDNIKKASLMINKKAIIECSGNIDLTNIKKYKGLNIDYISSGALTHTAPPLDLSMKNLRY